mmetsp:Transcript_68787/g.163855  ORF Transcript_68787/g.163855 Transcript_68787/m.163855 type:complete len:212 (+) Transcript_68787:446-1081(+)
MVALDRSIFHFLLAIEMGVEQLADKRMWKGPCVTESFSHGICDDEACHGIPIADVLQGQVLVDIGESPHLQQQPLVERVPVLALETHVVHISCDLDDGQVLLLVAEGRLLSLLYDEPADVESNQLNDFSLAWLLRHHLPLVRPQLLAIRGADQQSENLQVIVKVPFRCDGQQERMKITTDLPPVIFFTKDRVATRLQNLEKCLQLLRRLDF